MVLCSNAERRSPQAREWDPLLELNPTPSMKMILLSLLPVGLVQTWASVEKGYWYARSAKFNHPPLIETLRWVRVIVETIFAFGILTMGFFVIGLKTGWSITKQRDVIGKEFPETSKDS